MCFLSCRLVVYLFLLLAIISRSGISAFCNSTCQVQLEQAYIQGIQAKILEGLHLRAPLKNITVPNLSEEQIEDLLASETEKQTEKRKVYVLSKQCANDLPGCFSFSISQSTLASIYQATLRFFIDVSLFPKEPTEPVFVNTVIRRIYNDGSQEEIAVDRLEMTHSQRFKIPLNPEEIQGWAEEGVVGLTITAEYDSGTFVVDGAVKPDSENPAKRPTLVLELEPEKRRDRRHAEGYCPPESVDKSCCLHDMIVDFSELGWHFIMAPKRYNAFMCRGDCRFNSYVGIRFGHSKLMKDAKMEGALHCCHPSEYESLKVIYTRADSEIVVTSIPGMIAKSCACA